MKGKFLRWFFWLAVFGVCAGGWAAERKVLFERISAYHHIQVYDEDNIRTLSFNGSWETRLCLTNPLMGQFEYTEHFQMPWIWNHNIKHVLMAGLGGGSTQRAYQHYFTNTVVDTVEIDPAVVEVAKKYFNVTETPTSRIHTNDARVYLRRDTNKYDLILMDAYSTTRYGSSLPASLTTKEFFTLASSHLTTNGILGYNVIGQIEGFRATVVGAMYRTMKEVFPQVYLFPSLESQNIVFIATKSTEPFDRARIEKEAADLIRAGTVTLPAFKDRTQTFYADRSGRPQTPSSVSRSPILTDDFSPIESLLQGER